MGTKIFKMFFCRAYTDIKSSDLIGEKQLPSRMSVLCHILNKENRKQKKLYFFWIKLIWLNSFIIKNVIRNFMKLNTLVENKSKRFTNI